MDPWRQAETLQRGDTSPRMCREARKPVPVIRPARPTWYVWAALLVLSMWLPACSHWRESYLKGAVQEASQDEVIDLFGEPWKKKISILNGQTTWIYRYALTKDDLDPLGVNALSQGMRQATDTLGALIGGTGDTKEQDRPQCFHYVLTFDKANVLNRWKREKCTATSL